MPRDRGDVADFALSRGAADEAPRFSLTVMEDDDRPERPAIRPLLKNISVPTTPANPREHGHFAFAGTNASRQVPLRSLWPQFSGVASLHFVGFVDKKSIWRRSYAARSATDRVPS
jgi:hypothetical protein